jgi:hypothetical protein
MEVPVARGQHRAMKTNRIRHHAWMLLGLVAASNPVFPRSPVTDLQLPVRLYDYVNLPDEERNELTSTTARILRHAHIVVKFTVCYRDGVESTVFDCAGYLRPGELMLRILEAQSASNSRQPAFAAMTPEGGAIMTLYISPAARSARSSALTYGAVLGHAVAHEIGHLLMGANSHSPGGIMRAVWRQTEEELMVKRSLLFDSGQSRRIRSALIVKAGR